MKAKINDYGIMYIIVEDEKEQLVLKEWIEKYTKNTFDQLCDQLKKKEPPVDTKEWGKWRKKWKREMRKPLIVANRKLQFITDPPLPKVKEV